MISDSRMRLLLLALLIINVIGAVVYLILNLGKKPKAQKYINFIFFLVFPIVGEAFFLFAKLLRMLIELLKDQGLNMKELSFSKERVKVLSDVDLDKAMDSVPIEEALIVSKKTDKREAFIDVLKSEDYTQMMGQIKSAVENDDVEVAHYAASFVTHAVAKFKANEARLRKNVDDKNSVESICEYIEFMQENLNPSVLGIVELKVFIQFFEKAGTLLYERKPDMLADLTITRMVELLSLIDDTEKTEIWIARARGRLRESLDCFKICARYYYKQRDMVRFAEIMEDIKVLSVPLDGEALEWVRILKV